MKHRNSCLLWHDAASLGKLFLAFGRKTLTDNTLAVTSPNSRMDERSSCILNYEDEDITSLRNSETSQPTTHPHIPDNLNLRKQSYENFKSRLLEYVLI
jgi:hypothetical protein